MEYKFTKDNFETEVLKSDKLVLIDFYADWCGPCRTMSPIVDELAAEYEGKVVIGKCDVEENDDITMKYGVRNIPTIVFLKGGELVECNSQSWLVVKVLETWPDWCKVAIVYQGAAS